MALTNSSILPTKSLIQSQPSTPFDKAKPLSVVRISAVHSSDSLKNPIVSDKSSKQPVPGPLGATKSVSAPTTAPPQNAVPGKWTVDSWNKALQLPEYPDQVDLDSVLRTIDAFPPIVFAGEARSLEEKLGEAAMGNAFLLQGGDCAESFKEFNANNIRDTLGSSFRWLPF